MLLYDVNSTRLLEKKLISIGHTEISLMMKAGNSIFKNFKDNKNNDIIVIAGTGNNGGDAFACAIQAHLNNFNIQCISLGINKGHAKKVKDLAELLNISIINQLPKKQNIKNSTIIIDGILGIGISRKPEGKILNAINWINSFNNKKIKVISIDVPSGLNSNNGTSIGKVVKANTTVMCLTQKQGCYTGDGLKYSGKIIFDSLGIKNTEKLIKKKASLINSDQYIPLLRNKNSYKGTYGNLLILGGFDGMQGAANLCGLASLRTGVGKVFLCNNKNIKKVDEIITIPKRLEDIKKILPKLNTIIVGPGLGKNASDILRFIWNTNKSMVIDADALDWVSKNFKKKRKATTIYTPHYGEAKNLLKKDFTDRFSAIKELQNKYGGKWVLKGPGTLILNKNYYINDFANSILSTGGTGDILAGIIGGLLCQKITKAEIKGVLIHTKCAKKILEKKQKTIIASDLLKQISSII